jgi:hypothetical protein
MRVDQGADLMDVAFRDDAAVVDQQDVRRHRLDLVQDVARDDDALAGARPLLDLPNRPATHDGIHARQRFVEYQQIGVVDQGLRHLHALTHPLAVGANLLVPASTAPPPEARSAASRRLVPVQPHGRDH